MTHYQLVYDVTQIGPPWWFAGFGLLFAAVGALLWRYPGLMVSRPPNDVSTIRGIGIALIGFGTLASLGAAAVVAGPHYEAQRLLRARMTSVVEGRIENFHAMPPTGHDTERFRVRDANFAYSDAHVGPGFHQSSAEGGPLREGLLVRIHYDEEATILRLEIGR